METLMNYVLENMNFPIEGIVSLLGAGIYFQIVRKYIMAKANKEENDPNNKWKRIVNKRSVDLDKNARKLIYAALEITGLVGTMSMFSYIMFTISGSQETAEAVTGIYNYTLIIPVTFVILAIVFDWPKKPKAV